MSEVLKTAPIPDRTYNSKLADVAYHTGRSGISYIVDMIRAKRFGIENLPSDEGIVRTAAYRIIEGEDLAQAAKEHGPDMTYGKWLELLAESRAK